MFELNEKIQLLNSRVSDIKESAQEIKLEVEKKSRMQDNRIFGTLINSDFKDKDTDEEQQ